MHSDGTAVLVVGMHRTGTSVTAAALEALGVDFGQQLLPPGPDNETGYWEDKSILDLSDRLMAALGATWSSVSLLPKGEWQKDGVRMLRIEAGAVLHERFAKSKLWGFKNPRCIRVLPFWREVLRDLNVATKYVVTFRHPDSVAASLFKRNNLPRGESYFMWLSHYLPYLKELLSEQSLFINYDTLVDEPRNTLRRLNVFVNGNIADDVWGNAPGVDRFLNDTLRVKLRHAKVGIDDFSHDAPSVLFDTFALLDDMTRTTETHAFIPRAEVLRKRYSEDGLLLRRVDALEAQSTALLERAEAEEPIRDKIEKIGLYQADIHKKLELADARHAEVTEQFHSLMEVLESAAATTDANHESVTNRFAEFEQALGGLGGLRSQLNDNAEVLALLEDRVEDVQEKVVVQIDELHREQGEALGRLLEDVAAVKEQLTARVAELTELATSESDCARGQAVEVLRLSKELEATRAEFRLQLDRVYRSTSWRLTRPGRGLKRFLMKALGRASS
ncbi:MAG TPA: hypothetical protein VF292_02555 [Rhodanobacteraceae bacterium]